MVSRHYLFSIFLALSPCAYAMEKSLSLPGSLENPLVVPCGAVIPSLKELTAWHIATTIMEDKYTTREKREKKDLFIAHVIKKLPNELNLYVAQKILHYDSDPKNRLYYYGKQKTVYLDARKLLAQENGPYCGFKDANGRFVALEDGDDGFSFGLWTNIGNIHFFSLAPDSLSIQKHLILPINTKEYRRECRQTGHQTRHGPCDCRGTNQEHYCRRTNQEHCCVYEVSDYLRGSIVPKKEYTLYRGYERCFTKPRDKSNNSIRLSNNTIEAKVPCSFPGCNDITSTLFFLKSLNKVMDGNIAQFIGCTMTQLGYDYEPAYFSFIFDAAFDRIHPDQQKIIIKTIKDDRYRLIEPKTKFILGLIQIKKELQTKGLSNDAVHTITQKMYSECLKSDDTIKIPIVKKILKKCSDGFRHWDKSDQIWMKGFSLSVAEAFGYEISAGGIIGLDDTIPSGLADLVQRKPTSLSNIIPSFNTQGTSLQLLYFKIHKALMRPYYCLLMKNFQRAWYMPYQNNSICKDEL